MRILVFSGYWPRPGQIHKAMFEVHQIGAFVEAGHQVDVVVPTVPWKPHATLLGAADLGLDPNRVCVHQIIVPRLPEILGRFPLGIRANISMAGHRIEHWINAYLTGSRKSPDLVIVHGERNIGLSAGIWNKGQKFRAAMIVHGADPALDAAEETFLHRHAGAIANAGLTRVILVGNRLRSYARRLGYDPRRTAVIPNGFHHPERAGQYYARDAGRVRLVSVSRLIAVKGIDDTLNALAALIARNPDLDWEYDIVGDGPERANLQSLTQKLGLQTRVHFVGAVPNQQAMQILQRSAIFVLPSWNEAFGLAYLEAMAMGLAVIGCLENGAADILTNNVDGCLVPPRDVAALSKVLEELILHPKRRQALALTAMETVQRFSWPTNARMMIEAISNA